VTILERSGLALVAVDGHQPRPGLLAHEAPFAARGKAGATHAAQAAIRERGDDAVDRALARQALTQHSIAAFCLVARKVLVGRQRSRRPPRSGQGAQHVGRRVIHMPMADLGNRRGVARSHAWCAHNAHPGHRVVLHRADQRMRSREHARQTFAHPYRDCRRTCLAILDDVEVGVERGHLVDLRHGDRHQLGKPMQQSGGKAVLGILDLVQILDQQRALIRRRPDQRAHALKLGLMQDPALGKERCRPASGAGMNSAPLGRTLPL